MTRRALLCAAAGAAARAASLSRFRLALANDAFAGAPFPAFCDAVRKAGFAGVEVMPGTLGQDATSLSALDRRIVRNALVDNGLQLAGLHNLLESVPGLHATTADATLRRRTWDYIRRLVDLCADIGDASFVVLGSGPQRSASAGMSVVEASTRLRDGLSELAAAAQIRGVTVLIEPLPRRSTNVVNSVEQAAALVRRINSPAVRTMLNTAAALDETLPVSNLIRAYAPLIRYVHAAPGADLKPVFQALKDAGYAGWISAGAAGAAAGPERAAADAAAQLRAVESAVR
jgi:D-psicose/D-tagatose/L-ribulose 3-epimerase